MPVASTSSTRGHRLPSDLCPPMANWEPRRSAPQTMVDTLTKERNWTIDHGPRFTILSADASGLSPLHDDARQMCSGPKSMAASGQRPQHT
ncbi:unnamed protein product [Soboliphyme baturini]|uniref:Uncharacterized protein n=1 Tax=Soboliphyme baturini TaxID=241478 RepID=A0A183IDK6_9BILA|nr:unnamed protein product [Soboliphyme baturini]